MSDFLDRLACRAIGSEAALAPRLPSLFEPSQRAPTLALGDEGEAPVQGREAPAASAAMPAALQVQSPHAAGPAERSRASATPTDPAPTSAPAQAVAPAQRHTLSSPALELAPRNTPPVERPAVPSTAGHPDTTNSPSPVPPRHARLAPRPASVSQPACGSLRPAPVPVFAAPRVGPASAPPGQAVARRAAAAPVASEIGASSEPVVHVSIGRLEVRAVAPTGAASRRRDGPQPSGLDDYLRQRGDKGAR